MELTEQQLDKLIPEHLPHWAVKAPRGMLSREFVFGNFVQAFEFMTTMARVSEELNHHPEWSNVYNRVQVALITHDAAALTALDLTWAERADAAYLSFANHPPMEG